jgi:hypothetical protein
MDGWMDGGLLQGQGHRDGAMVRDGHGLWRCVDLRNCDHFVRRVFHSHVSRASGPFSVAGPFFMSGSLIKVQFISDTHGRRTSEFRKIETRNLPKQ